MRFIWFQFLHLTLLTAPSILNQKFLKIIIFWLFVGKNSLFTSLKQKVRFYINFEIFHLRNELQWEIKFFHSSKEIMLLQIKHEHTNEKTIGRRDRYEIKLLFWVSEKFSWFCWDILYIFYFNHIFLQLVNRGIILLFPASIQRHVT